MSDNWDVQADGHFAVIPYWVGDAEISDRAFRLYYLLRQKADNATLKVWGGRKRFAEMLGCSPASFDRAAKELEAIGALIVQRSYDIDRKQWRASQYAIRATRPSLTGETPSPTSETPSPTGDDASLEIPSVLDPEPPAAAPSSPSASGQLDLGVPPGKQRERSPENVEANRVTRAIWDGCDPKPVESFVGVQQIVKRFLVDHPADEVIAAGIAAPCLTVAAIRLQINQARKPATTRQRSTKPDFAEKFSDFFGTPKPKTTTRTKTGPATARPLTVKEIQR